MWTASFFSLILMALTVIFHYEAFRLISGFFSRYKIRPRPRILVVIFGVTAAHIIEIVFYSFAYYFLNDRFGLGGFSEEFEPTYLNFFYFSAVNYTSLGLSAFYPVGSLKVIAALESLNGFILITWSASFAYVSTGEFWKGKDFKM